MAPTTPKGPSNPSAGGKAGGKKAQAAARPVPPAAATATTAPAAAATAAAATTAATAPATTAATATPKGPGAPAAARALATPAALAYAPGQAPASPGQAPYAPGQAPASPGQAPYAPGQAPASPGPAPYTAGRRRQTYPPAPPAGGGTPSGKGNVPPPYPPPPPAAPAGPGTLDVYAYRESAAARAGAAAAYAAPGGVPDIDVKLFRDGKQVGAGKTGADGHAAFRNLEAGWFAVEATQRLADQAGRWVRAALSGAVWVDVPPGQITEARLPYLPSTTDLQVSAVYEAGEGHPMVPLPGVVCELEALAGGGAAGAHTVTRKLVLRDIPGIFEDVEEGGYALSFHGPVRFHGHAVELVEPATGRQNLYLSAGAPTVWPPVRFRKALGRIEGQVYDTQTRQGRAGVVMLLRGQDGWRRQATTGPGGEFEISGLPAGAYHLGFASAKYSLDGCTWAPAPGSESEIEVQVETGKPQRVRDFALELDRHLIVLDVLLPDGNPAAHAEIKVLDEQRNHVCTCNADEHGHIEIELERAGDYIVVPSLEPFGAPRTGLRLSVNSTVRQTLQLTAPGHGAGGGALRPAGTHDTVLDVPYPLLTESTSFPAAPSAGLDGGTQAVTALGQTVDATLRTVLGWRPRTTDARGFLAALNQAFTFVDVEGRRDFTWRQTSYAMQPDMGAITGAQASIYTRAKAALDQSVPLLDGLTALRPDADLDAAEAIRSVVRSEFTELVHELGTEGGPRVQRVSSLFSQLLGPNKNTLPADPEQVGGQLKRLRAELGMTRDRVNTVDDEQNLTNFLILVDYVKSLNQSWEAQRQFFNRNTKGEPFLGTQLVLVSRALAVLAESVQDIYFIMDSVFLGDAERQFVELQYADEPLTIAELLTWIETVATKEGPQLIQEGGKTGVIALQPTIETLAKLASLALIQNQDPKKLPASYQTARVQRSLTELAEHLAETRSLIQNFKQKDPVETF